MALTLLMGHTTEQNKKAPPLYKDASAPVEARVNDLLSRMTVEEKVAQLRGFWDSEKKYIGQDDIFKEEKFAEILKNGIGQIGPIPMNIDKDLAFKNALQKYLKEKTRLGIPAIFHDEGCHGLMKPEATSFPMTIGLASSWDPKLFEEVFAVVAKEMRARGGHQALTPILDVCRDPRWGRIEETYGEDPFLNSRLGAATVKALQGGTNGEIGPNHVLSTLKHFSGHGVPEGGLNRSPGHITPHDMREIHLFPFQYVIQNTNPAAVMPCYNEVDGVPAHTNKWLLQDILRKEYGYKGYIVSDYDAVKLMYSDQHVVADGPEAALATLNAGVEAELPIGETFVALPELIRQGKIDIKIIDAAVSKILTIKFKLGLFENPYVDLTKAKTIANAAESKTLALKAARESIVLLKNENNLLPLTTEKYKKIAVIGPNANTAFLGGYSGTPLYKVSVLEGIKRKTQGKATVVYAEGCRITKSHTDNSFLNWRDGGDVIAATAEENAPLIEEAKKVAATADVAILVIGDNEQTCREAWWTNHLGDRPSLELLGNQNELVQAVLSTGKPVIVYLMGGRPLAINYIKANVPAIIEGWYMGQETGNAAADILFGDVNPSGKLTVSFPQSAGHIPAFYNTKSMSRTFNYLFSNNAPIYPFGHGLSYTTFAYSNLRVKDPKLKTENTTTLSVEVTNSGKVAGDEVVQFYIRDQVSSVTRPVKELRGFERISLKPGETKTVTFTINKETLAFWNVSMNYVIEPGKYDLMVGTSSENVQKIELEVLP